RSATRGNALDVFRERRLRNFCHTAGEVRYWVILSNVDPGRRDDGAWNIVSFFRPINKLSWPLGTGRNTRIVFLRSSNSLAGGLRHLASRARRRGGSQPGSIAGNVQATARRADESYYQR